MAPYIAQRLVLVWGILLRPSSSALLESQTNQHPYSLEANNPLSHFLEAGRRANGPAMENGSSNGSEENYFIDPITDLQDAIPGGGIPGRDYPIFAFVPSTGFNCRGRMPGYYADTQTGCQVFHICQANNRKDSFLCANGTIFSQRNFVCDWWFSVDCSTAETFYGLNSEIGKVGGINSEKVDSNSDKNGNINVHSTASGINSASSANGLVNNNANGNANNFISSNGNGFTASNVSLNSVTNSNTYNSATPSGRLPENNVVSTTGFFSNNGIANNNRGNNSHQNGFLNGKITGNAFGSRNEYLTGNRNSDGYITQNAFGNNNVKNNRFNTGNINKSNNRNGYNTGNSIGSNKEYNNRNGNRYDSGNGNRFTNDSGNRNGVGDSRHDSGYVNGNLQYNGDGLSGGSDRGLTSDINNTKDTFNVNGYNSAANALVNKNMKGNRSHTRFNNGNMFGIRNGNNNKYNSGNVRIDHSNMNGFNMANTFGTIDENSNVDSNGNYNRFNSVNGNINNNDNNNNGYNNINALGSKSVNSNTHGSGYGYQFRPGNNNGFPNDNSNSRVTGNTNNNGHGTNGNINNNGYSSGSPFRNNLNNDMHGQDKGNILVDGNGNVKDYSTNNGFTAGNGFGSSNGHSDRNGNRFGIENNRGFPSDSGKGSGKNKPIEHVNGAFIKNGFSGPDGNGFAGGDRFTAGNSNEFAAGNSNGFATGNSNRFTAGNGNGFAAGNSNGFAAGNSNGFTAGNGNGFATGNSNGFAAGNSNGFTTGNGNGFATGNSNGFPAGNSNGFGAGNGFSAGNSNGFADGNSDGFTTGNGNGFATGNSNGFAVGKSGGFATGNGNGFATGSSNGFGAGNGNGFASTISNENKGNYGNINSEESTNEYNFGGTYENRNNFSGDFGNRSTLNGAGGKHESRNSNKEQQAAPFNSPSVSSNYSTSFSRNGHHYIWSQSNSFNFHASSDKGVNLRGNDPNNKSESQENSRNSFTKLENCENVSGANGNFGTNGDEIDKNSSGSQAKPTISLNNFNDLARGNDNHGSRGYIQRKVIRKLQPNSQSSPNNIVAQGDHPTGTNRNDRGRDESQLNSQNSSPNFGSYGNPNGGDARYGAHGTRIGIENSRLQPGSSLENRGLNPYDVLGFFGNAGSLINRAKRYGTINTIVGI
ncbi:probable cyclin-dependent serine/threonine-protein kinase DDB_G0292550 [Macrobrachium nipponense]|uniref:probable cyclin-dependent serine/threonine-protein kinase DDB_G0292550 n=1 Tax=Macrobrachium nipponense TaxID=159736 RepID=UPI0030C82818